MTQYHQRLQAGEFIANKPKTSKPKVEAEPTTTAKTEADPEAKTDTTK